MHKLKLFVLTMIVCILIVPVTFASEATADPDAVTITETHSGDAYKDLLMDALDQTVLSKDESLRSQIRKILYLDDVVVDAAAYTSIISAVTDAIENESLSENASLSAYTEADLAIAVDLIEDICTALDLEYSIDPSNDSQNEFARVITISKGSKVLGKLNSDAKTDTVGTANALWLIIGGTLLLAAFAVGLYLFTRKRTEA